jgi:hypothetical protein
LPAHNAWFPTASQAYGEATFICPQHNVLTSLDSTTSLSNATSRLYAYRYNVLDDENVAAGLGVPRTSTSPLIPSQGPSYLAQSQLLTFLSPFHNPPTMTSKPKHHFNTTRGERHANTT